MAIKFIPLDGGKIITTETAEDSAALVELSLSIEMGTLDGNKKALRRARRAWLRIEHLAGQRMESTAGIKREEIFGKGKQ